MERITLEIKGLPQEVETNKIYRYSVTLYNDEAYPVRVALRSSRDDLVCEITMPPKSHTDIETFAEFEGDEEVEIAYSALKDGVELAYASQVPKIKFRHGSMNESSNTEKWVKSKNTGVVLFLLVLSQVGGAIMLTFALLRLGTSLNFISFPWLDNWPVIAIWFIPWEAIVGFFGLLLLLVGLFGNGLKKGMLAAIFSAAICFIIMFSTMPNFFQVVFWSGENGERMEETIEPDLMTCVVGGNGHKIWLHNNPNAGNPSWEELLHFLRNDATEQHPYVIGAFVCADFAETLHNNAEKMGIRAAYVSVNKDHALNAFDTLDKGIIYIDAGGLDTVAHVVVGEKYTLEPLWSEDRDRLASVTVGVGIVDEIQVEW